MLDSIGYFVENKSTSLGKWVNSVEEKVNPVEKKSTLHGIVKISLKDKRMVFLGKLAA